MKIIVAIEDHTFADAFLKMLDQLMWTEFSLIRVIHVITPMDKTITWPGEECSNDAKQLVADFAKVLRGKFLGASVEEAVLEGHAAEVIIDNALEWSADLVLVGSYGKRGLSRFLIGNTASSVATHAPCSVLIVRPEHIKIDRISKTETIPSATP